MSGRAQSKFRVSEVALRLFIERGYENVTVEDVSAEAGVSRRTIFRLFGGKEELPFPDHEQRRANIQDFYESAEDEADPIEVVIAATTISMEDFTARPELVLPRFELTRVVRQLAEREVVEHEKYAVQTRRFLRARLPSDAPAYRPMAISGLTDAIHRSVLNDWVRSGGHSDALAELGDGMRWVREVLHAQPADGTLDSNSSIVAVLPNNQQTQALIDSLRKMTGSS